MASLPTLRRATSAIVLALALALTGCGGDEKDATKAPATSTSKTPPPGPAWESAKPAAGAALKGAGYTFRAVKGWKNATKEARAVNGLVEVAASAPPDATGFATSVNVVVIPDAGVDDPDEEQLDEASQAIRKELAKVVPSIKANAQTEIAEAPAIDYEGAATSAGVKYYLRQFVAFKDDRAYTITFQFSTALSAPQRNGIIVPVLASWAWQ